MYDRKFGQVKLEEITASLTKNRQIVHVDMMAIGKRKTFVAVVNAIYLIINVPVKSSNAAQLSRRIKAMISILKSAVWRFIP